MNGINLVTATNDDHTSVNINKEDSSIQASFGDGFELVLGEQFNNTRQNCSRNRIDVGNMGVLVV